MGGFGPSAAIGTGLPAVAARVQRLEQEIFQLGVIPPPGAEHQSLRELLVQVLEGQADFRADVIGGFNALILGQEQLLLQVAVMQGANDLAAQNATVRIHGELHEFLTNRLLRQVTYAVRLLVCPDRPPESSWK